MQNICPTCKLRHDCSDSHLRIDGCGDYIKEVVKVAKKPFAKMTKKERGCALGGSASALSRRKKANAKLNSGR